MRHSEYLALISQSPRKKHVIVESLNWHFHAGWTGQDQQDCVLPHLSKDLIEIWNSYSVLHLESEELCSYQIRLFYEVNTHLCPCYTTANLRRNLKFTSHYLQNSFDFWGQLDWSQGRLQLMWTLKNGRKKTDLERTYENRIRALSPAMGFFWAQSTKK